MKLKSDKETRYKTRNLRGDQKLKDRFEKSKDIWKNLRRDGDTKNTQGNKLINKKNGKFKQSLKNQ